jgi:hypothetical protein
VSFKDGVDQEQCEEDEACHVQLDKLGAAAKSFRELEVVHAVSNEN